MATASDIIDAETTVSRYFVIGNVKVRMSDHLSKDTDADMQIVVPYNGGTKYIVTIKDSCGKFLMWNANQIKDFIPSLQIMKGLITPVVSTGTRKGTTRETAVAKIQAAMSNTIPSETSLTFTGELINSTIKESQCTSKQIQVLRKPKATWNISEIGTLHHLFIKDLKMKSVSINEDVQIFLTCTSVDYKDILNIYKIIVKDNNKVPTIKLLQEAHSLIKPQQ